MTTIGRQVGLTVGELAQALARRHSLGRGPDAFFTPSENSNDVVLSATHDSRLVEPGTLFCCVPGERTNGHQFVQQAVDRGAVALLVDHPVTTHPAVAQFVVTDVRSSLGYVAAEVFRNPTDSLTMVGITGTNGKTSTAHLLGDMLNAAGHRTAVIGTLTQTRTTPEATDLQALLAEHVASGVTHVVMEVSSHALSLSRVAGITFDLAIFTNLTQDHLDFHETMEAYFRAKAALFTPEMAKRAIVNLDDPYGRLLRDARTIPTDGYSIKDVTELQVGMPNRFVWHEMSAVLALGGLFSVSNALAAASAATVLGVSDETIVESWLRAHVPGRFEAVVVGQTMTVIVDYAHTPDGLARVLESARIMVDSRYDAKLRVVFGCGGDRDRDKRPLMGEIASRLADSAVLTSDNPRSEPPETIIADVLAGVSQTTTISVESDRRLAIRSVLVASGPDDVIVIAGKGHEQGQETNGVIVAFDDRVVVSEELRALGLAP